MNLREYKTKDTVQIRSLKNKYYIILESNVYSLNYTGAVVIKYIGTDIELSLLVNKISSYYNISEKSKIETDILKFIDFLLYHEIVQKNGN